MKKILMLVTMIMMLAVSAVCSASNGKVLDAEEAIVDKFINGGAYLTGIAPLFACPGIAGLLVIALYTLRKPDETYSKKASMVVLALVCAVGLGVSLVLGIPPLLEGLGG